ncbi:MAG: sigma 54-interacting transcriptional regulator [Janthinobacterium lividum]
MLPQAGHRVVAQDPASIALLQRLDLVAPCPATVLITGESGTGKHLLATRLHARSDRAGGPFEALSCAAITEEMLDQELYGRHSLVAGTESPPDPPRKGAGKFEAAHGGTLLLDEVDELDARAQTRLLRTLQLHEQSALAGGPRRPDVRIVATASRPLMDEVARGAFRADLFFRLNVMTLKVPALRDRPGDILPLAALFAQRFDQHFAQHFDPRADTSAPVFSPDAVAALQAHAWPGNVRELENVIHRAVLTNGAPILTAACLDIERQRPAAEPAPPEAPPAEATGVHTSGRTIEAVEKDMILETLYRCRGNRAQTAGVLGISIRTLRNKLHEYERDGTRIPRPVIVAVA